MLGKEQPPCGVERVLDCTHMFSDHEISESFLLMFHKYKTLKVHDICN